MRCDRGGRVQPEKHAAISTLWSHHQTQTLLQKATKKTEKMKASVLPQACHTARSANRLRPGPLRCMTDSTSFVPAGELCGVWIDGDGAARLAVATPDGGRKEQTDVFQPFAWLGDAAVAGGVAGVAVEMLKGEGPFRWLAHAKTRPAFERFVREAPDGAAIDWIRPLENQYLLQRRRRTVRRADVCPAPALPARHRDRQRGGEASATRAMPGDRVLAIGLQFGARQRLLVLEEESDAAETAPADRIHRCDRSGGSGCDRGAQHLQVRPRLPAPALPAPPRAVRLGPFRPEGTFRNSRLKVAERWIDFPRCDLPGRTVVDTYLLVQLYDITTREMLSYGLKDVAIHFGVTDEAESGRTYIEGSRIHEVFRADRARFLAYLADDLRETKGVADLLLPTYFEQAKTFPILLQEATLRGTTNKIDLLFLEEYYHARQSCPRAAGGAAVRGRLYPQLPGGRVPAGAAFRRGVALSEPAARDRPAIPRSDTLGVFIPLLTRLRDYRLNCKQLARTAPTEELRAEYQARQASFKILINSFYGYLGFSGARFGDGDLAAEVTRQGRELLQELIDEFARNGCTILEADTDGIYLSSRADFAEPEKLLALVGASCLRGSNWSSTAAMSRCSATRRRTTPCTTGGRSSCAARPCVPAASSRISSS